MTLTLKFPDRIAKFLSRQRAVVLCIKDTIARPGSSHFFKRYAAISFLSVLLLYLAFASFFRASRKFFWFDEVSTIGITHQHSFASIWSALERAADTNPPPFYLVEQLFRNLSSDEHVGYRIPAVLGFLFVPLGLFWFVKTRVGDLLGLIPALFVLFTSLYSRYSIEARPYALVVGLFAIALVAWQRSNRPRNAWLLALLLAGATSLHFYAVLALIPFAAGETVRMVRLRQCRFHVWAAFGCACIPLVAFFPVLWQIKRHYGAQFWARPGVFGISSLYLDLLEPDRDWQVPLALGLVALAFGALVIEIMQWDKADRHPIPIEERVAMLGFILLPVASYFAAHMTGGGITGRYVLTAVLGISFAFACLARRIGQFSPVVILVLIFCSFAFKEGRYWMLYGGDSKAEWSTPVDNRILSELLHRSGIQGLPVVVSDGLLYFPMAYYASLRREGDFLYLTDPAKAIQYAKTDTLDRGLLIIAAYLPINVRQFSNFSRHHDRFLLYSIDGTLWDWWPARLKDDGYLVQTVATAQGRTLYLVDLTKK